MYKTTIKIDGMACGMCEAHVNEAIRKVCAAKKVTSSHKKGQSEVLSEQPPEETALRSAVEAAGYRVLSVSSEPYRKKGFFLFGK